MKPISIQQVAAIVGGMPVGPPESLESLVQRVVTDSREVQAGDLFVALGGENSHGMHFIPEARRRGAVAVLVPVSGVASDRGPAVVVGDSLAALWELATWNRRESSATVVGITGSFGKTTTRQMIHWVLAARGATRQSPKNFNNHVGVPLSLLRLTEEDQFAVLEIAASGPDEISELAQLVEPHVGILTGLGRAHLQGFGSADNVAFEKGKLLRGLPVDGLAVLPQKTRTRLGDIQCRIQTVGTVAGADLQAHDVRQTHQGVRFVVDGQRVDVPVAGRHFVCAALSTLAVARELGLSDRETIRSLSTFRGPAGRCHVWRWGERTVIDDTYNASPETVAAACHLLKDWKTEGRRMLVLGEMAELGDAAAACHAEAGAVAAGCRIDDLWACGRWARQVVAGAAGSGRQIHAETADSVDRLREEIFETMKPGDVLLVKGSRSARMERMVTWLREQFEERPLQTAR